MAIDDYQRFLQIAPDSYVTNITIDSKHISGNEWTWNLPIEVGEEMNTKEVVNVLDLWISEQMKLKIKLAKKLEQDFKIPTEYMED